MILQVARWIARRNEVPNGDMMNDDEDGVLQYVKPSISRAILNRKSEVRVPVECETERDTEGRK